MMDLLENLLSSEENNIKAEDEILTPLLPVIDQIANGGIRYFVRAVLLKAAPFFWETEANLDNDGYPPDEKCAGGNVLHTIRVARIASIIANSQDASQHEHDLLMAAALLHDLTKAVEEVDGSIGYDQMHPYTVEAYVNWVREEDDRNASEVESSTLFISEEDVHKIMRIIRCQGGVWSVVPETIPITPLEWTLHFADTLAMKLHTIIDGPKLQDWRWKHE